MTGDEVGTRRHEAERGHATLRTALRPAVVVSFLAPLLVPFVPSATLTAADQQTPAPVSSGQTVRPLMIGGAAFRIGMSQQEAMSLVAECCGTASASSEGMSLIDKKTSVILGGIDFKDGRVSGLKRYLTISDNANVSDFVRSLHRSVLDGKTVVKDSVVTLSASTKRATDMASGDLTLRFPDGRRLHLGQFTAGSPWQVCVELDDERVTEPSRVEKFPQNTDVLEFVWSLYRSVLDGKTVVKDSVVTLSASTKRGLDIVGRDLMLTFPDGRRLRLTQAMVAAPGNVFVQLVDER